MPPTRYGMPSSVSTIQIADMVSSPEIDKKEKSNGKVTSFAFYDDEKGCKGRVYFSKKKFQPKWTMVKVVHDDEAFAELAVMQRNILWTSLIGLVVLILIIQLFAHKAPKEVIDTMISEVKRYVGNTEQSDDLTLLVISYKLAAVE